MVPIFLSFNEVLPPPPLLPSPGGASLNMGSSECKRALSVEKRDGGTKSPEWLQRHWQIFFTAAEQRKVIF